MSLYRQQLMPIWMSEDLWRCTQFLTTQDDPSPELTPYSGLIDALEACSVASVQAIKLSPVLVEGTPFGASPYASVRDRAQIMLRSAAGQVGRVNIPAPLEAVFQSNHSNVDFGNPLIIELVSQIFATLGDQGGSPWVTVLSGKRMRVKSNP